MDVVTPVEAQRVQLEENVANLRKALSHWRTWDAEYEGLKEDLMAVEDTVEETQLVEISQDFGGELVNEDEIRDLLGLSKPPLRRPIQVIGMIERRQDYVTRNIETITKQLSNAEEALNHALELLEDHETTATPLPISEIIEELDEEGNVISSTISQPEQATAHILDTLRKAGIKDLPDPSASADNSVATTQNKENPSLKSPQTITEQQPNSGKKSVSFSDDTKPPSPTHEHATSPTAPKSSSPKSVNFAAGKKEAPSVKSSLIHGLPRGARVVELDEDDKPFGTVSVASEHESPEDARLRREMLEYSLNEVGSVVAELDLEEPNSDEDDYDDDYEDDYDDEDTSLPDSDVEAEDEYGRSTNKGISSDYRKQMLELQKKLTPHKSNNIGPDLGEDAEIVPNDLRRLVVRADEKSSQSSASKKAASTKSVRFAEELDIAPSQTATKSRTAVEDEPARPLADSIIEAKTPSKSSNHETNPEPNPENEEIDTTPNFGKDQVLVDHITERPSSQKASVPENDELDPEIQRRQLAAEYYRLRNSMIRQQGGFKPSEEEEEEKGPLMEETADGKTKKVSRFKAARMKH